MCIKHRWSPWSNAFVVERVRDAGGFGETTKAPGTFQQRTCHQCKLIDARKIYDGEALTGERMTDE